MRIERARLAATVDFPTPPFPLETATICLIPAKVDGPCDTGSCPAIWPELESLLSKIIFTSSKGVSFSSSELISDIPCLFSLHYHLLFLS